VEKVFKANFKVRWGDLDILAHMHNTAYLDVAADVRMLYFESNGFSMRDFENRQIGPVVLRDEIEYFRELRHLDDFEVHHLLSGMSENCSQYRIRNDFFRYDGIKAASVTSTAGWFDLKKRTLVKPPQEIFDVIQKIVKTEDFEILPNKSSKKVSLYDLY
jgi:acyl-CoA thioester hydrolase